MPPPTSDADMTELGANPGRILAELRGFADEHPHNRVRIVGEPIWPGRSTAEAHEATQHEALIDSMFAGRTASILCPYDSAGLPAQVLADAERTHAVLSDGSVSWSSGSYAPTAVCTDCDAAPSPEPADSDVHAVTRRGLAELRAAAKTSALRAGLGEDRATDWVLAVDEAAINSLQHGTSPRQARLWRTADELLAEVASGGGLRDALAGRRKPDPTSTHQRGLWMIHQLCDLVETRQAESRFVLRLHMRLPYAH